MKKMMLCLIAEEILELTDQISHGGKTIHGLERMKKILDVEKSDIRAALEEAEVTSPPSVNSINNSVFKTTVTTGPLSCRVVWSTKRAKL